MLAPIFVLGFSEGVINTYIVIVGFQAVFNHANVQLRLRAAALPDRHARLPPLAPLADDEAIDKNYAAHFAFIDYLFGTAVKSDRDPEQYGVVGDYMPDGFWKQVKFPFTWKG